MIEYIIILILVLIVTLSVVYYNITDHNASYIYPPVTQSCPDFYRYDFETKECKDIANVFYSSLDKCYKENFDKDEYKVRGTDINSGSCKKKLWANSCKLKWDGITNNDKICLE